MERRETTGGRSRTGERGHHRVAGRHCASPKGNADVCEAPGGPGGAGSGRGRISGSRDRSRVLRRAPGILGGARAAAAIDETLRAQAGGTTQGNGLPEAALEGAGGAEVAPGVDRGGCHSFPLPRGLPVAPRESPADGRRLPRGPEARLGVPSRRRSAVPDKWRAGARERPREARARERSSACCDLPRVRPAQNCRRQGGNGDESVDNLVCGVAAESELARSQGGQPHRLVDR
mmetsp:Transcript_14294/g.53847  ORF Transcript_14294/g.53847 Transcript_14294/m.53847 type:complete len:233 (+) Transcript_14294:870-1568(+)